MQDSDIPTKISVPFGKNAGGGFIRTVPVGSQIGINAGFASFTDGFVPLNFTAIGAGGIPPFGQDMNGVLNAITKWTNWYNAGAPVAWDSAFATAIGGYPKGAIVASAVTFGYYFMSLIENNMSNPDSGTLGGTNWAFVQPTFNSSNDTGTANVVVAAFKPIVTAHVPGLILNVMIANTNTGAATFNPGPSAKTIVWLHNGSYDNVFAGMLQVNKNALLCYNGTYYELLNPTWTPSGTTNLFLSTTGALTNGHVVQVGTGGNAIDSGVGFLGNGSNVATTSGAFVSSHYIQVDGSNNFVDSGVASAGPGPQVVMQPVGTIGAGIFASGVGNGNIQASGYSSASFDAAGAAAAAAALAVWTWSGATTLALGITVFYHALGLDPLKCGVRVAIINIATDAGYAVGDVVHLSTSGPANSSNNLLTVFTDAAGNNTEVIVGVGITIAHKSTFAATNLTLNKWYIYIGVIPNH